ncbi:uncharacterized protein PHACADRAFT_187962 [Phanerochaete carnosa HHB-10118-sp]|uniref:Hydrophobin n=1 Tax=Phanerochaete carnosa (strain HHB-10118-sp) TaxID=650164 RepID=K5UNY1_PHACS|nr:uncharacterized protein PHACADRAFT_187962 [Phanerochaete carnosa HHB-10118-sp]EKM51466.1 hypothetical protein PHACADRAFT_187962 [Phanerochaete carnosa HHB-10118-sp]
MGQLLAICCILAGVEVTDDFGDLCGGDSDASGGGCCCSDAGFDNGTEVVVLNNYNASPDLPQLGRSRFHDGGPAPPRRPYAPEVEQRERRRQRERLELQLQRQRREELFSTAPLPPPYVK